jgi:uncharacterized protein involved in type VI secretion and phage assembly
MSLYDLLQNTEDDEAGCIKGVAIGIVTNNKDEKGLGRVKVRFPWRENDQESYWARIATLMAGKERGSFFLPEVNDEVLVAFEKQDVRFPFVLGVLWNGQDKPPETNSDGKNNIRKITSRSGHEIIFNDNHEQKKERIEIHTKAGHRIVLDDAAGAEKIEIKDKTGSNSIVIDSTKNSMALESTLDLTIKSQKISIEAGAALTLKAGATLTVQGTLVKIN